MIDFMKWKLSSSNFKRINSTKRRPIITHHVAHHPKHLNVRVLPDAYKKQVTLRFEEFLDWIDQNSFEDHVKTHAKEIVNGVVSYMNSDSYYSSEWNNFLKYTQDLDNIRNQNLTNIEPKFKEFYATNI